ncbi:MAG: hypothetical protein BroJett014_24450 [Planctomycetota bacterium]|jgi:hypothetical protein|nr:MAG: hypothetical protein BroJett014_24450 [Planctomycetota bacterium]
MYKVKIFCFLSLITLLGVSACGGNQEAIDAAVQQTVEAQIGDKTENPDDILTEPTEAPSIADTSENDAGAIEVSTDTIAPLDSWESQVVGGGVWLAQRKYGSFLIVFTPEGNVLSGNEATYEIVDSTLIISSFQDDYHYVEEYDISLSEDENAIILSSSFVDGSGNTITEEMTLTHHSEYQPVSLSSLNLENSFWGGGSGEYIDLQSNNEDMIVLAFMSDKAAYFNFRTQENTQSLPVIRRFGDFTVTENEVFITFADNLIKFSVSALNKDTMILTSDDGDPLFLQRMNPDIVEKAFPTAPVKNEDEIINGLTPGIWIRPAEGNGGIAFLPNGTFIDGDTLELGTYEALTENDSLYMSLTSEDDNWDDIFTITRSGNDTITLEGSLSGSLQLEKYIPYEATAINTINLTGNWYFFNELFITDEYQNQEWANLLSGDDLHVFGNSVILSNADIMLNFTAYPFSEDILYLHSPVPGYNAIIVRATD